MDKYDVRSGMRALHRAREGQEVVLLNDSERSLNLFIFFFFNFCIEPVVDINSIYQYTASLQVYSVKVSFTIVNSKSIYKYKHAYENGYDGYMVTYSLWYLTIQFCHRNFFFFRNTCIKIIPFAGDQFLHF